VNNLMQGKEEKEVTKEKPKCVLEAYLKNNKLL
jgi:hypothetical protein